MRMAQITARFMCAGVVYNDLMRVMRAAPIINYMKGWTADQVRVYCERRKFHYHEFDTESEE